MRPQPSSPSLNETISDRIARTLSSQIIEGIYKPGDRMREATLSKEFGVSHGPIRDALRMLQNYGLVVIHPYRGAQITELTIPEVEELYRIRAALVGIRARWLAEDPDREQIIGQARTMAATLVRLSKSDGDAREFISLSLTLNQMLTDTLVNRWLRSTLQGITMQTSRYSQLALASADRRRESAKLWKQLIAAIASGDGDLAERIATTLSLSTRDAAVRNLSLGTPEHESSSFVKVKARRVEGRAGVSSQ